MLVGSLTKVGLVGVTVEVSVIVFVAEFILVAHRVFDVEDSFNHTNTVFSLEETAVYVLNLEVFDLSSWHSCSFEHLSYMSFVAWCFIFYLTNIVFCNF